MPVGSVAREASNSVHTVTDQVQAVPATIIQYNSKIVTVCQQVPHALERAK